MVELAARQPGFLGAESARDGDGFGATVSYWESAEAIAAWKDDVEHLAAQELGKRAWYEHYELKVAKVERAYAVILYHPPMISDPTPGKLPFGFPRGTLGWPTNQSPQASR